MLHALWEFEQSAGCVMQSGNLQGGTQSIDVANSAEMHVHYYSLETVL